MRKVKNRHKEILFHFQNLMTLWIALVWSFRNTALKCTSRWERTVSKQSTFTYDQRETVCELIVFLKIRNRVSEFRQSKFWHRFCIHVHWSNQRGCNCSPSPGHSPILLRTYRNEYMWNDVKDSKYSFRSFIHVPVTLSTLNINTGIEYEI